MALLPGRTDPVARSYARSSFDAGFDDACWEVVTLPHTVRNERLMTSGGLNYQGEAWYRRRFFVPDALAGMDVFFELEGAMQRADAWLKAVGKIRFSSAVHEGAPASTDAYRGLV